jgi:pimeloyl-ACP methyl ester carboxylesterase
MRRRSIVVVVLSVFVLATVSAWAPGWTADAPRAQKTSYTVLSRSGGAIRVAALEWLPPHATTVLLALHGLGAVKENSWAPLAVPGYSFALHQYEEGRATVAIDFPGSGESEGNAYLTGVEDLVSVVTQIADILRGRFDHVVGVGHSLGALVVNVAQGVFGSFDAIIPAAYSHGGNSEEFKSACRPPNTPGLGGCPNIRKVLFTSYADPRVVDDYVWRLRAPKPTLGLNLTLYFGPLAGPHLVPTGDEVTSAIDVPVLLILGKDDFVWDTSKYAEEPSHYPSAPDVKLVQLPRAGHAVFHHLNHRAVDKAIEDWLTKHKL